MLPPDTAIVSVDDHIIEPPHLWQSRLPSHLRDRGPRVVEVDGKEGWLFDGSVVHTLRGNTRTLPAFDQDALGAARFSEMRPGCYDATARLADMDADGVWAHLCFPDYSRFAGHRFLVPHDPELGLACIRAYNDFVHEEWTAVAPDRLPSLGILPLWDPVAAAAEVRRLAALDFRAIAFSENPTVLGLPSVYTEFWEPLWDAVSETGLVVCLHIGSSSKLIKSSDDAPTCSVLPYVGANSMVACTDWMYSGILDRHPSIQVAFSEGGAGWVPYLLEQAELNFHEYRDQIPGKRPPREVFAEHMTVCFMHDDTAMRLLDVIGVDRICWESDYPHDSGSFPTSRAAVEATFSDVPDEVAVQIVSTNARRLFRI